MPLLSVFLEHFCKNRDVPQLPIPCGTRSQEAETDFIEEANKEIVSVKLGSLSSFGTKPYLHTYAYASCVNCT